MKFYCFNKDVFVYDRQPLIQGASIINYISATQKLETDLDFVRNFVKHNKGILKGNSYITLIKGSRKKFLNNDKSSRKRRVLENLPKPVIFFKYKPNPLGFVPKKYVSKGIIMDLPSDKYISDLMDNTLYNSLNNEQIVNFVKFDLDIIDGKYNYENNEESKEDEDLQECCNECDLRYIRTNLLETYVKETKVLLDIKAGDKLCVYNGELKIDDSYNIGRMFKSMIWNGYSRNDVIDKIEDLVQEYNNMNCYEKNKIKEHINLIKTGINNLIETYKDDNNIKNKLNNILLSI